MTRARVLAHRWHFTFLAAVLLGALSWALRGTAVSVPSLSQAVPAPLLVAFAVIVVVLTPLYASFPQLQQTLPGEPRRRCVRAVTSVTLGGLAALPSWLAAPSGYSVPEVPLVLVLTAIGLTALVLLGDLSWALVVLVGLGGLVGDGSASRPVSKALHAAPLPVLALAVLCSIVVYVRFGPRGSQD